MNTTSPVAMASNSPQSLKGIGNREDICVPHLLPLDHATKSSSALRVHLYLKEPEDTEKTDGIQVTRMDRNKKNNELGSEW